MYLTTTISVVLVLFLIGMECVVFMATRRLLQDTRQGLALTLVLNDQVDSLAIQNLGTVLRSTPFCHDYKYISKEEYEDNTYTVANYMFEDDTNIVEICFWTVNTDAEYAAVDEIINTLKKN